MYNIGIYIARCGIKRNSWKGEVRISLKIYPKNARPATWDYTEMTRQRENEEYEPRQLDYGTGLEMEEAVRKKGLIN